MAMIVMMTIATMTTMTTMTDDRWCWLAEPYSSDHGQDYDGDDHPDHHEHEDQ